MRRASPCSRSPVQTSPASWVLAAARPRTPAQRCLHSSPKTQGQPAGAAVGGQGGEPGCSQASATLLHTWRRGHHRSLSLARPSNGFLSDGWYCLAPSAPRPGSAGSRVTRKTCWNTAISSCTAGLSFQAANQKKMDILLWDTTECDSNVKYFVGFWKACNFCCRLLLLARCRLLPYASVGLLKCPVRNRKAQFYFYLYSCKSVSAGVFEFSK